MSRFVYNPKVEVFISLDDAERGFKTIDVTDDIVRGSVERRLNAVSEASIVLQNKHGKYTGGYQDEKHISGKGVQIKSMDRIIIRLSRVGPPFLVFSGYVDESPYYQIFPDVVTVKCSDPLKLIQNTYFDPGLPYLTTFFKQFGWFYDYTSGILYDDPSTGGPNNGTFGNFDISGGVGEVIKQSLIHIGGWNENAIDILDIDKDFLKKVSKAMNQELSDQSQEDLLMLQRLEKLFGSQQASNTQPGIGTGGTPVFGNVQPAQVAKLALDAGFKDDAAVTIVAIAYAESSLNSSAIHWNTNHSYDFGLWQINTVHAGLGPGTGLPGVGSPGTKTVQDMQSVTLPAGFQTFMQNMFDPAKNAAMAFSVSGSGTNFTPWFTYPTESNKYLTQAQQAVGLAKLGVGGNQTTGGTPGSGQTAPPRQTGPSSFLFPITIGVDGKIPTGLDYNPSSSQSFGDYRSSPHPHRHAGVDIAADQGTALLACVDGKILYNSYDGAGAGYYVTLQQDGSNKTYNYFHLREASSLQPGAAVKQGAIVGRVGHTGDASGSGFNHLHFEYHPNGGSGSSQAFFYETAADPGPTLKAAWKSGNKQSSTDSGTVAGGDTTSTTGGTEDPKALALQAAWFTIQLQSSDFVLSQALTGKRALANDIPLLTWISSMIQGSARVFTTKPDGTFFAFFPDRFGYFTGTPYFRIEDIELKDLTIQHSDQNLTTHVFVTGSLYGGQSGISWMDKLSSTVASVESPAFSYFINVNPNDPRKAPSQQDFDVVAFLRKYGARPFTYELPDVRHPILLWMAAWMKFVELWAKQYQASASMTFMPELLPGGLVDFGGRITMFVEGVTHTFDREAGFTTNADLSSPATVDPNKHRGLPIEGARLTDGSYIDSSQFGEDIGNR